MNQTILFIIIAYLVGSIPFGFLIGRVFFKKDIRTFGSGNIGATNTFRVLGKPAGLIALVLDILKGAVPLYLFTVFFTGSHNLAFESMQIFVGLAALVGHTYSVFLGFKGGKGAATAVGIILVLTPKVLLGIVVVWLITTAISKYVSLASMLGAISFPILSYALEPKNYPLIIFALLVAILIIYKHRSNIKRIINKTEPKIWS